MYYFINYEAPFGTLTLGADEKNVLVLKFGECNICTGANEILYKLANELDMYFDGSLTSFSVPTLVHYQSQFSKDVLEALRKVEYGKTITYAQLARLSGHPDAYRAVGSVMHNNNIGIIYPCHRIVSASSIGGYAMGVEVKKWLLTHEKVVLKHLTINS